MGRITVSETELVSQHESKHEYEVEFHDFGAKMINGKIVPGSRKKSRNKFAESDLTKLKRGDKISYLDYAESGVVKVCDSERFLAAPDQNRSFFGRLFGGAKKTHRS